MIDEELQEIDALTETLADADAKPASNITWLGKEKREAANKCIEHLQGFSLGDAIEIVLAIKMDLEMLKEYKSREILLTDSCKSFFQ